MNDRNKPDASIHHSSLTTHNSLVPRLRFPEFLKSGEWEERLLGTQGDFLSSLSGKTAKDFDVGNAKFIPYMNVFSNTFSDIRDLRAVDVTEGESQNAVAEGDVFFTVSSETPEEAGMSSVLLEAIDNCYLNSFCAMFRFYNKRSPNPVFLGYWLRSGLVRAHLSRGAQGATRYNISKPVFREVPLLLPPPLEQQKIADCLWSLDALIAAQADKIDALKTHKKGLMQQLFPREGETVPRLRFPEFRDAGEWVSRKLSKLLKKVVDPVTVEDDQIYREVGIRSHGKGIFHKEPISGKAIGNKRVFWIEENTLIVNIVFAWELAVANTTEAERGMIASHRFPMYRPKENKADVRYMKYFFLTHKGKELLWIASPGGAGRNKTLGQKDFESLEVLIPERLTEQQKIADCLSSVDELIDAQMEKLDTLKDHKKGLMQQLFPGSEGVAT